MIGKLVAVSLLLSSFTNCYREIKLGFLIAWSGEGDYDATRYAGAITRVLDDVKNNTKLLPNINITYKHADTGCSSIVPIKGTIDLAQQNVSVFIGPYCSDDCLHGGLISTYYKIPLISFGCSSIELTDKRIYPYIGRVKPYARMNKDYAPKALLQVLTHYNWTREICIIYHENAIYKPLGDAIVKELQDHQITFESRPYNWEHETYEWKKTMLLTMKKSHRIFILVTTSEEVRQFMIQAWNNNLRTGYAFLTVDYSHDSTSVSNFQFLTNKGFQQGDKSLLYEALTGLIYPDPTSPNIMDDKYNEFRADVLARVQQPPFNFNLSQNTYKYIRSAAAYLYDATMLYLRTVDSMITKNEDFSNVTLLMKAMKNVTFQGITGEVLMDDNIDRVPSFEIYNIVNEEPFKQVIAIYDASRNNSFIMLPNEKAYFPGKTTQVPVDVPACGFYNELCLPKASDLKDYLPLIICLPLLTLILIARLCYQHRKKQFEFDVLHRDLVIDLNDVVIESRQLRRMNSEMSDASNFKSKITTEVLTRGSITSRAAVYKSKKVFYKTITQCKVQLNKELLIALKHVKNLDHQNVNSFVGVVSQSKTMHILWAYCDKGSLKDILRNDDMELDWSFKTSFANDVIKGLTELHRSPLRCHGNLTSSSCVIDNRWTVKLTGFPEIIFLQEDEIRYNKMIRLAPEKLQDMTVKSQAADIYQYGMILYEICTRCTPFELEKMANGYDESEILEMIKSDTTLEFQPSIPSSLETPIGWRELTNKCLKKKPLQRPSLKEITGVVSKLNRAKGVSLVDHMLGMMEKYTNNLEHLVKERTKLLEVEKIKSESLLFKMLPRSVANKLKEGEPVLAEYFHSVTIYFSDIVGFTALCSESTPLQVVEMLNDLYSWFDQCVDLYDVYKVETIGDAYMVVSGLPIRNGNKHAGEIARMALNILQCMKSFRIKHKPDTQLQLRIGLHSGSCVSGVVGTKMPRYCLFGDTVNTASRMESTGVPLCIHVSPECKEILDDLGNFELKERGPIKVKGKGVITTYFLVGIVANEDDLSFKIEFTF